MRRREIRTIKAIRNVFGVNSLVKIKDQITYSSSIWDLGWDGHFWSTKTDEKQKDQNILPLDTGSKKVYSTKRG